MILDSDVFSIGRFTRTHGIHGEIEVHFTDDVFDRGEADYVFLKIDGLYVPFFLEDYRFKGSESALFTLDGIDSDTAARELVGHTVYYPSMPARPRMKQRFRRSAPLRGSAFSSSIDRLWPKRPRKGTKRAKMVCRLSNSAP